MLLRATATARQRLPVVRSSATGPAIRLLSSSQKPGVGVVAHLFPGRWVNRNRQGDKDAILVDLRHMVQIVRGYPPAKGHVSSPGGKLEWGERLEKAAIREISEETGLPQESLVLPPSPLAKVTYAIGASAPQGKEQNRSPDYHYVLAHVCVIAMEAPREAIPFRSGRQAKPCWDGSDEGTTSTATSSTMVGIIDSAIARALDRPYRNSQQYNKPPWLEQMQPDTSHPLPKVRALDDAAAAGWVRTGEVLAACGVTSAVPDGQSGCDEEDIPAADYQDQQGGAKSTGGSVLGLFELGAQAGRVDGQAPPCVGGHKEAVLAAIGCMARQCTALS